MSYAPLADLAMVRSGFQFRGAVEHDPLAPLQVVQARDVDERYGLRDGALARVWLDRAVEPYEVQVGDVLFLSRGTRPLAVHVDREIGPAIAASYFYILRPGLWVRPDYLAWWLNQPPAQDALRLLARGSNLPFVPKASFMALSVAVPPLAIQERIAALHRLLGRELDLLDRLAERRAALVRGASLAALRAASSARS